MRIRVRGKRRTPGERQAGTQRPQTLATQLANFARRLYALTCEYLDASTSAKLDSLYRQARTDIKSDLTSTDFADLLAQTLVYCGLLVRCYGQEHLVSFAQALNTFLALSSLPDFVRQLLRTLWQSADAARDALTICIRELAAFLAETNIHAMLDTLRPSCLQGDPLIYFYEIFLTAYAPRQRSQHGVYYTPAPAIAYMIRAIDQLLRDVFAYPAGLIGALQEAQRGAFLCDPACGTGAFLWAVLEHMRQVYRAADRAHDWQRDLLTRIQPHLAGFEIMPTPYLLACIKLATQQAAVDLPASEQARWSATSARPARSPISLINALDDARVPEFFPRARLPIILGNPPYAGHSLNHSTWIDQLLESYKKNDPGLKKPGQAKWLSDDYVKFLRLAQWQVEQAGRGIVAFLTSHSYLDNPTFRGLRLSLLQSFDEIYILDLHGNSKKRELAPGGAHDHNIFSIQQGVAIGIFVKHDAAQQNQAHLATVHHADVWGSKEVYARDESGAESLSGGKLGWLAAHDLSSTPWQTSRPAAPFYLFAPRNDQYQAEYMAGWSLPAIFALNGEPAPGLVTCHDEFAISWTAEEVSHKITALLATTSEVEARSLFRLCAQNQWNYSTACYELSRGNWRDETDRVLYRPFDTRWTVFERHVAVHRRERVTRHMRAGPNLALAVGRAGQVVDGRAWDIAFCSRLPTDFNLYRRGGNYLFPLYLYASTHTARVANLAPAFIAEASQRLALTWLPDGQGDLQTTFGPEDLFAYIYALLYSPAYRTRYAAFLKIDFPRISFPSNNDLFRYLCSSGRNLIRLHLLEQSLPANTVWSGSGDTLVKHVHYLTGEHDDGRISINTRQNLSGVPRTAWELTIGGYQIAKKWLKDRRGRLLMAYELDQYQQIIAILTRTAELMVEIDKTIEQYKFFTPTT